MVVPHVTVWSEFEPGHRHPYTTLLATQQSCSHAACTQHPTTVHVGGPTNNLVVMHMGMIEREMTMLKPEKKKI